MKRLSAVPYSVNFKPYTNLCSGDSQSVFKTVNCLVSISSQSTMSTLTTSVPAENALIVVFARFCTVVRLPVEFIKVASVVVPSGAVVR